MSKTMAEKRFDWFIDKYGDNGIDMFMNIAKNPDYPQHTIKKLLKYDKETIAKNIAYALSKKRIDKLLNSNDNRAYFEIGRVLASIENGWIKSSTSKCL